jgi:hypothetical protein
VTLGLADKVVRLHQHLTSAALPHAFGGALALAYCTAEPRATKDIDVNVFIAPEQIEQLLSALPSEVAVPDPARRSLARDGQARLWWDETPVDVFLSNHPFHDRAEDGRRAVPFADVEALPVLACADLAVFKALFARPRDAVDVATMVVVGSIDLDDLRDTVTDLLREPGARAAFFTRVDDFAAEI